MKLHIFITPIEVQKIRHRDSLCTMHIWCSIVERLEHLVLSVCCFLSYCLLTPVMSPKDKK